MTAAACASPEDEIHLGSMHLDLTFFRALAKGYLAGLGPLLGDDERAALPVAGLTLTLINAVRFLTDYLQGDVYSQTHRDCHNLDRCRAQLQLVELMHAELDTCRAEIAALA